MPQASSLLLVVLLALAGCGSAPDVVVYAALDGEFSQPILDDYERRHGLDVAEQFDTEAFKTVGLYRRIVAEASRPRCDLFWNNEIITTLRLERLGLLSAYRPPRAKMFPARYRSRQGYWHGFAARARVLIVNTKHLPDEDEWPKSILDLPQPRWKGRLAMAKPLFGTTFTHACCLFAHWGDERAERFYRDLKRNEVRIVPGNKDVAERVASGQFTLGLTDTDDAMIYQRQGHPVAIVYLDRDAATDDLGTLFIPNTVAIIKGGPNPQAARRLVDYLLTAEVERRLAQGESAQIPLARDVTVADLPVATPGVGGPNTAKPLPVDFAAAAEKWDVARAFLRDTFGGE